MNKYQKALKEKKESGNYQKCISCNKLKQITDMDGGVCIKCNGEMKIVVEALELRKSMCIRRSPVFYDHENFKICRFCFKPKPLVDFGRNGRHSYCKACDKAWHKVTYIVNGYNKYYKGYNRHDRKHEVVDVKMKMSKIFDYE